MYKILLASSGVNIFLEDQLVWSSAGASDALQRITASSFREALSDIECLKDHPSHLINLWLKDVFLAKQQLVGR